MHPLAHCTIMSRVLRQPWPKMGFLDFKGRRRQRTSFHLSSQMGLIICSTKTRMQVLRPNLITIIDELHGGNLYIYLPDPRKMKQPKMSLLHFHPPHVANRREATNKSHLRFLMSWYTLATACLQAAVVAFFSPCSKGKKKQNSHSFITTT